MSKPIDRSALRSSPSGGVEGWTFNLHRTLNHILTGSPVERVWATSDVLYSDDPKANPNAYGRQDHKSLVYATEAEAWDACRKRFSEWSIKRLELLTEMQDEACGGSETEGSRDV